jgi:hypothetical protein
MKECLTALSSFPVTLVDSRSSLCVRGPSHKLLGMFLLITRSGKDRDILSRLAAQD